MDKTVSISVLSGKGGVTKTSLARVITSVFAEGGQTVLGADMDTGQNSFSHWYALREMAGWGKPFTVQSFATPASVENAINSGKWGAVVIDCPAFGSAHTVDYAKLSDLIVIPTRFSLDDMRAAVQTANELVLAGIPDQKIIMVFSGVSENKREYELATEYMANTPYFVISGYIPQKTALSQAQDIGKTLLECSYPAPREKAEQVIQGIFDRLQDVIKLSL